MLTNFVCSSLGSGRESRKVSSDVGQTDVYGGCHGWRWGYRQLGMGLG